MINDPVPSSGGDMPRIDQLRLNDSPVRARSGGLNKGLLIDRPLPSNAWAAPRDPLTSNGSGLMRYAYRS